MPEISVLIYTARDDYPYVGKAEGWHCFEPVLRTLATQTFKDFELVLVDALYETRPDWFRDHPQTFSVKHVPSKPNYWQERGRVGIGAQINRGFIWADGKYVWIGAENNLFLPEHLTLVSNMFRAGKVPVAWYAMADRGIFSHTHDRGQFPPIADVRFDMQGITHEDVCTTDHRGARFVGNANAILPCHPHNYYGYSGVPTDVAVGVNGYDELMDGHKCLQDVDFGMRVARAGCELVMHRDLYVIEPPTRPENGREKGYGGGIRNLASFQCNYAILLHNEITGRRANRGLPDGYVEDVQARACRGVCAVQDKCRSGAIWEAAVYPFCAGEHEALARGWYAVAPDHELAADRELRKQGVSPYDKGFFQ